MIRIQYYKENKNAPKSRSKIILTPQWMNKYLRISIRQATHELYWCINFAFPISAGFDNIITYPNNIRYWIVNGKTLNPFTARKMKKEAEERKRIQKAKLIGHDYFLIIHGKNKDEYTTRPKFYPGEAVVFKDIEHTFNTKRKETIRTAIVCEAEYLNNTDKTEPVFGWWTYTMQAGDQYYTEVEEADIIHSLNTITYADI